MTIKKKIAATALISIITILALFASAWFLVSYKLSHLDTYKESITRIIGKSLNRDIDFGTCEGTLTFRNGLAFNCSNVVIGESDGSSGFLNIKNLSFGVNILHLLINRLDFSEVFLDQPHLSLRRDRQGLMNIGDFIVKKDKETAVAVRGITIEGGVVTFLDQAAGDRDILTSLDDIYCIIDLPLEGNISRFRIKASIIEDNNKAQLSLDGVLGLSLLQPLHESTVTASIRLKGVDINHYYPYLKGLVSIEQLAGNIDVDGTFSGKISDFTSKGNLTIRNGQLSYSKVFNGNLSPGIVELACELRREPSSIKIDISRVAVDSFEANGHFAIYEMDKSDPLLEASAVTSNFYLREVRSYVPWKIIEDDVSKFIQTYIKDGDLKLVEGTLKGRLSQIADMNGSGNGGVLYIRGEVKEGIFDTGSSVPLFHDFSGILELENRSFSLKQIKGFFGFSPFTMEGSISDFALPGPVTYTSEMEIQPARDEILWLLGKEEFNSLAFEGSSVLILSGKGTDEEFQITADWDLTPASYLYPDVIEKPIERNNHIRAKLVIKKDAIDIPSFNYDVPPLNLSGLAIFSFSGEKYSSFTIRSEAFGIPEVLPLFPVIRAFNPEGTCMLDLAGKGYLNNPDSIKFEGGVSLEGVSFQPSGKLNFVKGLNGEVVFKGSGLELSLLKAQIGESDLHGWLGMADFRKPEFTCHFNSALLRTADLGFKSPEGEVNLQDVNGKVAIEDKKIHVEALSFGLNKSTFNLSGDMIDSPEPEITLELTSPYINSSDFSRLKALRLSEKEGKDLFDGIKLEMDLRVDEGVFNAVDLEKLKARFKYDSGTVYVEGIQADLLEGTLKAKGTVNIHRDGHNHYEGNISVEGISLEQLQDYMEMGTREISGYLSFAGDLSATGSSIEDCKKTVAGMFDMRAEKGVLKRFSVLSKIFSLLNVYQLVKLQLPDMAKDGMPYDSITGQISVANGVFSSEKFLIESDAMHISGVGKADFLRKELNCIVGIHPLQTIDFIVSKIPIAGWIVTDEEGNFITVHVKVDGTWDNPSVAPITVQSIGKGTLDIFRRVFQLPEKIITDPGKVILGH